MGGGGSGTSKSTETATIPDELKGLYSNTAYNVTNLQNNDPVQAYAKYNPMQVAPLSNTQNLAIGNIDRSLQDAQNTPLENAPIVQAGTRYFNQAIAPGIENQSSLSGLGRSTALTSALGAAQANTILPLLQGEQQRRDQLVNTGMQTGDVERSAAQDVNTANYQDFLRNQALAEQATFGPLGQLPSTIGQQTSTKTATK